MAAIEDVAERAKPMGGLQKRHDKDWRHQQALTQPNTSYKLGEGEGEAKATASRAAPPRRVLRRFQADTARQ